MRFILKILALPIMLALGILRAMLAFIHSMASWVCWGLCVVCLICGLFSCFVEHDTAMGIKELIGAFVLSPYGLPAAAGWIVEELGAVNYALHSFVFE